MDSCTSKAPERKKQESDPATKPPAEDCTQLPAIDPENRETYEKAGSCVTASTPQTPTPLQKKLSAPAITTVQALRTPERKKQECEPAAKSPAEDLTQLPAIIAENRETDEKAGSCVSATTPQISTPHQQKLSHPGVNNSTSSTKQELSDRGIKCSPKQDRFDPDTQISPKQELSSAGIHSSWSVTNNQGVCAESITVHGSLCMNVHGNVKAESFEDVTRCFTQLQQMMKRHFKATTLNGLPWMKNIKLTLRKYYVTLKMTTSDSTDKNLPSQNTTIEQTFKALEGQKELFRILVEGGPGFGKTTLAAKLAYDWAQGEAYVSHFDIVLFIALRHYVKDWRETLRRAARLRDDDRCEMLLKILMDNTKRLLIIFDGYDELSEDYVGEVNAIIQREILPDVTVIVTSRPGKFTSDMKEEQSMEVAVDVSQFIDKIIVVEGLNDSMQTDFIKTYTARFSNIVQHSVLENIDHLQTNEVLTAEFLHCPLFLLMIILLLTEDRNADMQNLKTRTDLYKRLFNFVVRRYFSKDEDSTSPEIELFSCPRDPTSTYLQVMIQFSHFALYAIQENTFAFSREEILDNCVDKHSAVNLDSQQLIPLNLGFLTESVLEDGFWQETRYEPIHKSLLEFAAAFCIWTTFLDGRKDLWQNQIHSLRPRQKYQLKSFTSLVFPFLSGMMGKDAWVLFDELRSYAAEYSLWFEPLKLSILEAPLTPKLITTLGPLLPLELNVIITDQDNSFAVSKLYEEIIRCGTQQGKIKIVIWDVFLDVSFPQGEVTIERLVLELVEPSYSGFYKFPSNGVKCQNLWCCCQPLKMDLSFEAWDNAIILIQKIQSRRISFVTHCGSFAISRISAAMTLGLLQKDNINYIRYVVEHNYNYLDEVSVMIRANQIEAIELILYDPEGTCPDRTVCTPLIQKKYLGKCCKSVSQEQMDHFVKCASQSTKLVRFVVENDPCNPLTIDLSLLCDRGYKSWKSVCLKGVTLQCSLEVKNSFQISHFQITDTHLNTALDLTNNLLRYCHVSSFACSHQTVLSMNDLPTLNDSLTEFQLQLDEAINLDGYPFCPMHIYNLQILVLELTSFVSEASLFTWMDSLFLFTKTTLHLRGIELLGVENNHRFVELFADCISGHCTLPRNELTVVGGLVSNDSQKYFLYLQYVMLHTEIQPDEANDLTAKESMVQFLSTMAKLKSALKHQLVSQLEVLCYINVLSCIWDGEKEGAISLNNIFPVSEGFSFEHDYYGMRDDDSLSSKELYGRTPYPHNRVSIKFNK